jgi:vacuolar protein sorting-associated protein VTA1
MLYDIITTFGELSEEAKQNQKYAKWKAAYIHNCLKNNEQPHPGPLPSEDDELLDIAAGGQQPENNIGFGWNSGPSQQPNMPPVQPSYEDGGPASNDPFLNIRAPSPPKDPEEKNPGGFGKMNMLHKFLIY